MADLKRGEVRLKDSSWSRAGILVDLLLLGAVGGVGPLVFTGGSAVGEFVGVGRSLAGSLLDQNVEGDCSKGEDCKERVDWKLVAAALLRW